MCVNTESDFLAVSREEEDNDENEDLQLFAHGLEYDNENSQEEEKIRKK